MIVEHPMKESGTPTNKVSQAGFFMGNLLQDCSSNKRKRLPCDLGYCIQIHLKKLLPLGFLLFSCGKPLPGVSLDHGESTRGGRFGGPAQGRPTRFRKSGPPGGKRVRRANGP
jgi:hypothetical protein